MSATLTYNPPSGLTVTKTSNPSTLTFPGQTSRLTITLTAGTQSVTGLAVTDYFTADGTAGATPNGMAIAPTPAAATTCPGGVVTAAAGGTQVGLSIATLAAGASCTLSVNVTSTAVGGITNFIPTGAVTTHQGLSNAGPASTSLTTQSNIGVTKQFTPNVVKPGERSRLRITFYNPTGQPLSGISTTDNLPAGVTVPAGSNPVTTCTGGSVTSPTASSVSISGASLPAASGGVLTSCYAEIDVVVAAQGDYVNTIPIGGVTAFSGGNTVTNSQPTSDTLRAKSPVVIAKAIQNLTLDAAPVAPFTAGTATRAPGQAGVLAIRLTNPNAVALTAVGFTDTLPAGLVVAATPGVSNTCAGTVTADPSGTQVRLAGATLAANASCLVNVNVLSNFSGTYTNTIPAGGVTTSEGVTNDEPTRARVIVSVPPGVAKQFAPAVIPPGGTSRLTIFIANENASALTLTAALTDTLPTVPGQVSVANPPNVVNTCTGTVTAPANATSVVLANGATVPSGGCSIAVDVTASSSGTHNNTIPAGALQTNLGVNPQPANAPLVVSTLGYVSGRVFQDNNTVPNGAYESGTDTPLAGVTIELRLVLGRISSAPDAGQHAQQAAVDFFQIHFVLGRQHGQVAGLGRFERDGRQQCARVGPGAQHRGRVDALGQRQPLQHGGQRLALQQVDLREQAAQIDLAPQVFLDAGFHQLLDQAGAQHHRQAHGLQVGVAAGVRQLLGEPGLERVDAHHHQRVADRADAGAQSHRRRVDEREHAVDQQRLVADDLLQPLHRLLGIERQQQLRDHAVRRLQRLVAPGVQHVLGGPAGHGPCALLVQAVLDQRPAGHAFVDLAGLHRAGPRVGLALAACGLGLQRLHGGLRAQVDHPPFEEARHVGQHGFAGLGAQRQLDAARGGLAGGGGQRGVLAQPGQRHLEHRGAWLCVLQQLVQ